MTAEPKPLRVLLVSHGLPPESLGGVEQHVDGLARALVAAGHDVEIWTRTSAADRAEGEVVADPGQACRTTRVVYRYSQATSLQGLYEVPLLDAAFERFLAARPQFDVAHVHHLTGMSTGLLAVLRAKRIPTLLTLHDYWLLCPRGQMWDRDGRVVDAVDPQRCAACLQPTFASWLPPDRAEGLIAEQHARARALLALPDRLLIPSATAIPPFAALGVDPARIRVVTNAVHTDLLASVPPLAPHDGPLRLGYLGTVMPSKGLDVLVDALQRLPPRTASLAIHGNTVPYHGDEGFATRVFARLRPGDAVTYHGPYGSADLPGILTRLDLVVVPALWRETFGLTAREAMAAGRPVVASRIGGLAEAFTSGREGIHVTPGSATELATAIAGLAADPERLRRMGHAARGGARSFAAMAAELAGLYREVMAHRLA